MTPPGEEALSRREREILDIVYARGQATAAEIREGLADPPSYSAVRGLIRVLEQKGHLRHQREGARNVYSPVRGRRSAGRSAMKRALEVFFDGDVHKAMAALVDVSKNRLDEKQIEALNALIERAREEGR